MTILAQFKKILYDLLLKVDEQNPDKLRNGEKVYVNLIQLSGECGLKTISFVQFTRFLCALAHENADSLRLFKHFARQTRYPKPGYYEFSLLRYANRQTLAIVGDIFKDLRQTIDQLARLPFTENTEWHPFDLYQMSDDRQERLYLHQRLLWLDLLGLISYVSDPAMGLAMHIAFKQEDIAPNQLDIDLKPLRLMETLAQKKLQLMHEYATQPEEMRANLFKQYFFGNIPLIEDHKQQMRSDLTAEQQHVVTLTKGYHLIEGPAGSGKTTVLTEHVKYLVYDEHVPAERIMVITHYHSAISRITKELDDLRENGHTIFTATINSFGERIFKQHLLLLQQSDGKPYYAEEPKVLSGSWKAIEDEEFDLIRDALNHIYQGKGSQEGWPTNWEFPQPQGQYKRDSSNTEQCRDAIHLLRQH